MLLAVHVTDSQTIRMLMLRDSVRNTSVGVPTAKRTGGVHNWDAAVAHGVQLIQAARLEAAGHEPDVGRRRQLVRKVLIVALRPGVRWLITASCDVCFKHPR